MKDPVFVEALSKDLTINAVHVNVAQEYIVITEDKTYRCLTEWEKGVRLRESWIAPFSVLISLVLAFATADFRDAFGLPKDTWRAIFVVGVVISGAWLVKTLYGLVRSQGQTVDELIVQLKKGAVIQRQALESVTARLIERE